MKKLNIKKLAAIATGAVLVGTAVAPIVTAAFTNLTKDDVVNAQGEPVVSVVAGTNAAVSDFVWAGNIAAKVAQLSTRTVSVTSGAGDGNATLSNVSVDLTIGGSTTVSGGKEYKDSYLTSVQGSTTNGRYEFGRSTTVQGLTLTGRPIQLSHSQLPSLYEATDTLRYNGSDTTVTMKEYIGINADARFDTTGTQWKDLALFVNGENDFNYTVDLGTGIYRYEATAGATDFQDDQNDNQRIPLCGKRYVVQKVANTDTSSINYVRLIEDTAKQTFSVDDTFTVKGKAGYAWAGETLTVTLTQIGQYSSGGSYTAKFTLYDEDGVVINTQSTQRKNYVQFQDAQGNYVVQDSIYFDDILVTNTQDLSTGTVDLYVGAASVDLYDGKGYPYDASNTNGPWDWKVTISEGIGTAGTSTDANKLLSIAIGNSRKVWDATNPIFPSTPGQSLTGKTTDPVKVLAGTGDPNEGYAYIDFKGWEEKESTTPIVVGSNNIKYKDTSGTEHNIPFYINLSTSASGNSFSFDTKTVYYKTNTTDLNFTLGKDNNGLNGIDVVTDDSNTIFDTARGLDMNMIAIVGNYTRTLDLNNVAYTCTVFPAVDGNKHLNCLADGNVTFAKATITSATSTDYLGGLSTTLNKSYYYDDGNTTKGDENRAYRASPVVLEGANSQTYNYALYVNETYSPSVWLLLDAQTMTAEYNKHVRLFGTDTGELGQIISTDPQYYFPDVLDIGGNPADNSFSVAQLAIDENNTTGTYDMNVYIDSATHKTVTFPNVNLSNYSSDVNFNGTWEYSMSLRNDEPYLHQAYTDWGSKVVL